MGGIQWRSERWLHHEGGAGGAQDGHQWQGALVWWRWVMVCHVIVIVHLFSLHPGNYILDLINLSVRGFNTDSLQLEYSDKKQK